MIGIGKTISVGQHNAVVNGEFVYGYQTEMTFVASASDLALIEAKPGDFAATYGLATMWQYDGTNWQEV